MKDILAVPVNMGDFARKIMTQRYAHDLPDSTKETWNHVSIRVPKYVFGAVGAKKSLVNETQYRMALRQLIPAGRYLSATGRPFHQVQNCLLLRAEDSREGWSDLMQKSSMALMTGAGIGVFYGHLRCKGTPIRKMGGVASGPVALMQMVNEAARFIRQGGTRRAAIWAGLPWNHPDVMEFIVVKNWRTEVRKLKESDFDFPAPLDMTNISVCLDDEFFDAINNDKHPQHSLAHNVYWTVVKQMLKTGEPGFSVNVGKNAKNVLRNACTEVDGKHDSDVCNLVCANMARCDTLEDFETSLELATALAVAGGVYSDVPYPKVDQVRTMNRRIGIELMGIHEWLLKRGKKYGPDPELTKWLETYVRITDKAAKTYSDEWDLAYPIARRALGPNGTIGIIGETTTSGEPLICVAYKRRSLKGDTWQTDYVIDPVAQRLIEQGVNPDDIEDAYSLAAEPERRIGFQAYLQKYVDQSISSTVNMPSWGSELNNDSTVTDFGLKLLKELPNLRGITVYPDGARGGQPLTAVSYKTAIKKNEERVFEQADICDITKGGSCSA